MSLMQRGFTRLFYQGKTIELNSPDDYTRGDFQNVYVLVDRLTARPDVRQRLVDSLEICFQEGHGTALIETAEENPKRLRFSERFECKNDGTLYATPEPRLFSVRLARDSATPSVSILIW
jgi:excinuclease ABC subunit A